MRAGAEVVFADCGRQDLCLSLEEVRQRITPETRAVVVVHIGGHLAFDIEAMADYLAERGIALIEDCAHAHGARWNGQGAGTIGHFGSFSLQSSKTLTSGEGGVLICKTAELAQKAASIINCGRSHAAGGGMESGNAFLMGANYRMSELQSALARVGVERFPEQARQREEMAAYMDEALSEIPGVRVLPRDPRHTTRSFYRYIFAIDPEVYGVTHEAVCAALDEEGIGCWTGYQAMHHYELFQPQLSRLPVPMAFPERFDFAKMELPEAERACQREAVWLGEEIFRAGKKGVDDAVAAMRKIYEERAALAAAAQAHGLP